MIEPPSMKQLLCSHAGYVAWANDRILAACSALSTEELERDLSTSHVNMIGVLRHMYYAERVWQKRLRENVMPPLVEVGDQRFFRDASPEPDLAALRDRWPAVWHGLRDYYETITDDELAGDLCGVDCRMARWKVLMHLVNHATIHRGQVVGLLRQLGKRPPNTDIFGYYLDQR